MYWVYDCIVIGVMSWYLFQVVLRIYSTVYHNLGNRTLAPTNQGNTTRNQSIYLCITIIYTRLSHGSMAQLVSASGC